MEVADVMRRLAGVTVVTYALLVALTQVPVIDSASAPYVDLTSLLAQVAYWVAQSGGVSGAPVVVLIAILAFVSRSGVPTRRRLTEAGMLAAVATICAGGGALINENGIKTALQVPRPNIVSLAGVEGRGPLRRTPEQFYALAA